MKSFSFVFFIHAQVQYINNLSSTKKKKREEISLTGKKMETILEDQRRLHEERERLMDVQVKELLRKKTTVSSLWAITLKKFS